MTWLPLWFLSVFVLDLIAFALALAAEQRKNKGTEQTDGSGGLYCSYSRDAGTSMAVGSMLFLLAAQILVMVATSCLCCCASGLRPGGSRACAIILFIISWVSFILAEMFLLAGTATTVHATNYKDAQQMSCDALRKTVYGAAAAFVVFTGILSEFYYFSYSRANAAPHYPGDTGVTMTSL